jgi:hypothetical protein
MDSAEERRLAEQLAEELRKLRVEDVIVQTLVSVRRSEYRRLGLTRGRRRARSRAGHFSIATIAALARPRTMLGRSSAIRELGANLQLAYARAAAGGDGDG